jgi:hypothetical protein
VSPERTPVLPETRNNNPTWFLKIHDRYYVKEHVSSWFIIYVKEHVSNWFIIYVKAVEVKAKKARFVYKNRTNKYT